MAEDKIRKLAEELADRHPADAVDVYERILREGLRLLLEKSDALRKAFLKYHLKGNGEGYTEMGNASTELHAELQAWRKD